MTETSPPACTADAAPMTIAYATNLPGHSQGHTGTQVRIAATGPQAANVLGVIDQTDLFTLMARALDLLNHGGADSSAKR